MIDGREKNKIPLKFPKREAQYNEFSLLCVKGYIFETKERFLVAVKFYSLKAFSYRYYIEVNLARHFAVVYQIQQ